MGVTMGGNHRLKSEFLNSQVLLKENIFRQFFAENQKVWSLHWHAIPNVKFHPIMASYGLNMNIWFYGVFSKSFWYKIFSILKIYEILAS